MLPAAKIYPVQVEVRLSEKLKRILADPGRKKTIHVVNRKTAREVVAEIMAERRVGQFTSSRIVGRRMTKKELAALNRCGLTPST